ncbi:uncharacterized protein DFL_002101 [Arthrobotrys flagrans]|uniref:Major facilitator superfamily (MFS) profile domain-containing protein n=1 Tax=Arthrobotrys flagrans TaxID=97331 RepID=A0A437A9X9_ARTFL|nr:hypothetical protein DFL_002101 [Arthrobotrys flagrans]
MAQTDPDKKYKDYGTVDDPSSSKRVSSIAESEVNTISISTDNSYQFSNSSLLGADEEARLLNNVKDDNITKKSKDRTPAQIIAVLLLGVFIANGDGSFVLATNGVISSEFGRLDDASWLVTSYMLTMCALQPLYGKLSDIYGRKAMVLISYAFFGLGCLYSGVAQSLIGVIIGRAVSGIGGAGMNVLVSILITDLVPQRDVAAWRAYVNIAATTGRSLGGPVGGYLTDTVGWRWSFGGQAPLVGLAGVLVALRLNNTTPTVEPAVPETQKSKLARIDFLGSFLLATTIVGFLLVLDLGGQRLPWSSNYIIGISIASVVFLIAFALVEIYVASEPIFPLHLLTKNNIATSYGSLAFSTVSQIGIMYTVPRYFQITRNSSVTEAGAQLVPAVVGNVIGGLITGLSVKRTGRYKLILVLAGIISTVASTLLILRWNGQTGFLESLYIFPGGFGMGLSQAASFVAMTAGLEKEHYAVATMGLYLASSLGAVAGIIEKAIKDVQYIGSLKGETREIVVSSYVTSLKYSYGKYLESLSSFKSLEK